MSRRPRRHLGVKCEDLGTELLIYDEEREAYHLLNTTARLVWQLCDGTRDDDEIAAEVARHFPTIDPARIATDVRAAIDSLEGQGIVRRLEVEPDLDDSPPGRSSRPGASD